MVVLLKYQCTTLALNYFYSQLWYPISKTLAEKAAWDFAKDKGLDVVVVNPGTVMGPAIPPRLNASMIMLLRLLQGKAASVAVRLTIWN